VTTAPSRASSAGTVRPYSSRGAYSDRTRTAPSRHSASRTSSDGERRPIAWPRAPASNASASVTRRRPPGPSCSVRSTIVRARPVTRYEEPAGHGELEEHARGRGMRRAIGQLLVCPFCIGQWVAGGLTVGIVAAPRVTRLLAGMFTMVAAADFLHLAHKGGGEARLTRSRRWADGYSGPKRGTRFDTPPKGVPDVHGQAAAGRGGPHQGPDP
jgi:hypothetical protein